MEEKDYSLDGKDRAEWDRLWSARTQRLLTGKCKLDVSRHFPSEKVKSVTIADDPTEFAARVHRVSEICPVCGETTAGQVRLGASLEVTIDRGLSLGMGVWVHPACFERCA